jgi:hypothetical protein
MSPAKRVALKTLFNIKVLPVLGNFSFILVGFAESRE